MPSGLDGGYTLATCAEHNGKFGAGDDKLGALVVANDRVGADIRKELEAVFPAQAALVDSLRDEWRRNAKKIPSRWGGIRYKDGWITGLDGRPIRIESEHAILVYMLQSDEAIMMSVAYLLMYKRLSKRYKWKDDFAIVCWYHDEVTVECREEIAKDVAAIMEQCIADAGAFFGFEHCPQKGEASIGKNWYECH